MQALLLTGDFHRGQALARGLGLLDHPLAVDIYTNPDAALARLGAKGVDVLLVDLAHPPPENPLEWIERLRREQTAIPIVALVGAWMHDALAALNAGADGFAPEDLSPAGLERLAAVAAGACARQRTPADGVRVLYFSRIDPMRDPAMAARMSLQVVNPGPGTHPLPAPYDSGPWPADAVVVDMSGGALDLLGVLQEAIERATDQPVIVLADAGDRLLATAALRLGVDQVVAKSGAWPVRLTAAVEHAVAARRIAAEARHVRGNEARLRLLLESLPVGVMVLTREGIVLAVNATGLETLGVARADDVVRGSLADRIAAEDRPQFDAFLRVVAEGARQTVRVGWREGGAMRALELSGTPFARSVSGTRAVLASFRMRATEEERPPEPVETPSENIPAALVPLQDHAALKAHLEASAREADVLRVELAQLEDERRAYADHVTQEMVALQRQLAVATHAAETAREAELAEARREIADLRAQVERAADSAVKAHQEHEQDAAQVRTLVSAAADRDGVIARLERDLEDARGQVRAATTARDQREAERAREVGELRDALRQLESARASADAGHVQELAAVRASLSDAERTANDRRDRVVALEARLREALDGTRESERRAADLAARLESERAGLTATQASLAEVRADLERWQSAAHQAREAADRQSVEVGALQAALAAAKAAEEQTLADRQKEIQTLCAALDEAEKVRAVIVGEHEAELAALRASIGEREATHAIAQAALETERTALRRAVELAGTPESRRALEQEVATLRGALGEAEAALAERSRALEAVEHALRARDEQLADVQRQAAALETQLRAAHADREGALLRAAASATLAQQRLEDAQAREQRWFDNELVGMAVTSAEGQPLRTNATFARLFQDAGAEVLRRLPDQWIRATTSLETLAPLASEGRLPVVEAMITLPDGRPLWYLESAVVVMRPGDAQPQFERWFMDVTARHQAEHARRERRGIEAVGQVAADFIREVDQHLLEIRRLAGTVAERVDARDARVAELNAALVHARRANEVTQQFLAFSRSRLRTPDWIVLADTIDELRPAVEQITGEGIRLVIDPAPGRIRVNAPREALARTFLSLITSAVEALPLGGTVTVRMSSPTPAGNQPDGATRLSILPSGFGIQPLREPGPLDPLLAQAGATLRVIHDGDDQAYALGLRASELAATGAADMTPPEVPAQARPGDR
jgi:PAS domain S-box-containing protein